jgi:hypothetical protein
MKYKRATQDAIQATTLSAIPTQESGVGTSSSQREAAQAARVTTAAKHAYDKRPKRVSYSQSATYVE